MYFIKTMNFTNSYKSYIIKNNETKHQRKIKNNETPFYNDIID